MQNEDNPETTTTAPATVPPPQLVNPLALFAQRNQSGAFFKGPLIKCAHSTGEILRVRGEARTLVEPEERFTTNPHELIDTWSLWIGGKLIERHVYRALNGEMAPAREELGDTDKDEWPKGKDPWQRQVFLPMKGDDDEVCAFSATGKGAISEIGELIGMYASTDRHGKFPVVEIESRSFESQHGNTIYVPVFRLVDWQFWEPNTPATSVALVPMPTTAVRPAITARKAMDGTDTGDSSNAKSTTKPKRGNAGGDLNDVIPF